MAQNCLLLREKTVRIHLTRALDDTNPQVLVEFERYFVHDAEIPGIAEYRQILRKCKAFWILRK